jgi:tRNA 2-thiouridine synthesizing protein A
MAPVAIDDRWELRHRPGMTLRQLDLTGLKCPLPALKTRKALRSIGPGERLEVRCTDPLAAIDIPNLVNETGDRLETIDRNGDQITFLIIKAEAVAV